MTFQIEVEEEADGRWIAEVPTLPGVLIYGVTRTDAVARVQALALRVLADRLEHGEAVPELLTVTFQAAGQVGPPPRPGASLRRCCGSGGPSSAKLAPIVPCPERAGPILSSVSMMMKRSGRECWPASRSTPV
jgi:predicted RNase H-like HicB family nuclease